MRKVALSPAARNLLDGGGKLDDIIAARTFIAPFIRTDQSQCFGTANLHGANMMAAERPDGPAPTRVAITIDSSGSMAGRVGSRTKLELARTATQSFIDGLPPAVPASLAVFGQQGNNSEAGKVKSCKGVDLLAPMSADRAQMRSAIAGVRAVGWTPLAAGLTAARNQLGPSSIPGEQVVYVVSDGIETCGGDPVAVARDINRGSTRAVVNIIGFGLPKGEASALQAVASAGGGRFVNVTDDDGFDRELAEQMRLSNNRVRATLARAGNSIATGATSTDLVQCTGGIVDRETQGALAAYDARAKRGEKLPPRYQVVALLRERQGALEKARDEHETRQDKVRDAANNALDAQEKAAR
ncbi:VWA domain-containing protein [Sphingomonas endolithica]|uniref:VWA domain-containing protein n=1 Tax=Sphingomonas endolithica TaxID=2972485 RepID=UPI0021AFF3C4|nr:VWA domain-containing protein [Sphingomonas sp. ZFBP2030]